MNWPGAFFPLKLKRTDLFNEVQMLIGSLLQTIVKESDRIAQLVLERVSDLPFVRWLSSDKRIGGILR